MLTRVSTTFQQSISLDRMQQSNVKLAEYSYQVSSGLVAQRFEDMASQANQLLTLKDVQSNSNQYVKNIEAAMSRLNATENALQGMTDLINEAINVATLGRNENTAEVRATLAPKAEGLAESFNSLFRSTYEGRFVFSGAAADRPPLTTTPSPNTVPATIPAPTTYYTGDTQRPVVISNVGVVEEYGVTGDDDAFANLKAGLEGLWFGLQNNSETDLDGAIDLLNQAQEDLSRVLGDVGGQLSNMELIKGRHENTNIFLQERVDEIEKVDVAEAMTQFTQEQTVLQASMSVMTQLSRLTLLDYIR